MGLPLIKNEKHYNYGMYKSWPEDERWELIHGIAYNMCAAPSRKHQGLLAWLSTQIYNFLTDKKCQMYFAPFDVRLPESDESDDDIDTVVQPDIVVYCDNKKLDNAGAKGAPDLAVEILSPSTSRKDLSVKFELYEMHSVKEYWVIDPIGEWIQIFTLGDDGKYDEGQLFEKKGIFPSRILSGFKLDIQEMFDSLN